MYCRRTPLVGFVRHWGIGIASEPDTLVTLSTCCFGVAQIDMIKPPSLLLPLVDSLIKHAPVPNKNVLMVSALKKSGIDDLKVMKWLHVNVTLYS